MVSTNAVRYPVSSVAAVGLMAAVFLGLFTIISQRPLLLAAHQVDQFDFTPKIKPRDPERIRPVKPDPIVPHPTVVLNGPPTNDLVIDQRIDVLTIAPAPLTELPSRVDSSPGPLVRPDPEYPRMAMARGIEGWVELQFTVSGSGAVTDVLVIDADPKGVFDAAATKALRSWKYAPRVREGRAVEQRGMRVVLRFDLD